MDERLKGIKDNELLTELGRRGWQISEKPIAISCCGRGRKVTLVHNPWEPGNDERKQ